VIASVNQPIGVPFKVADASLQQILRTQTSRSGQSGGFGGRGNAPPSRFFSPPGFGTANLANPARPPGADPLGYTSVFSAGAAASRNKFQTNQVQSAMKAKTTSPPPSYP
jgi:hypothetical protein